MATLQIKNVHPSWQGIITQALTTMDPQYLQQLSQSDGWLPGEKNIFNAFSLPLDKTRFILFGESPYPRRASANGYAFWDANADKIWSDNGLAKTVNRATSLRNFVKMLLVAEGALTANDTGKEAVAKLNKHNYLHTVDELFLRLMDKGVLLLNASLVLSEQSVRLDAKAWQPFMASVLDQLADCRSELTLLLFGNIAKQIQPLAKGRFKELQAEHPYNLSFISNPAILDFFRPLNLLAARNL